ncbi:MAG: transglutaminase-like cysteine peptidase [Alphaproteobacteria bacterium]|jgi:predicted transglutaminase-like cysteine proteinase|nr:transglutaminase-like cysteine peptidase [Alphaproteobacteria bacterium]MDP6516365.1 transglutaminase-like cysteine peptidase [Alphaproteobacteria bacterium]|tara:strand:- start:100 stop:765 length:666 start_codon:yes stop_codon:yes gene_type:complete
MLAAAALAVLAAAMAPAGAADPVPSIFNSTEIRKEGLKPFPKWTGALEKYFAERDGVEGGCEAPKFNRCHYKKWFALLEGLEGKKLKDQLKAVNKKLNSNKYIVDMINWGVKDYWETPGEFFEKYGDCEDYSIAKFLSLRALGVPAESMRVVVVKDLNLDVAHAILAVYTPKKVLILDNQLSIVVEARRIRHYRPIFSVSETGWWKHINKKKRKKRKRRSE